MSWLIRLLRAIVARLLRAIGLARTIHHVDVVTAIHITIGAVTDSSGAPVTGAEVILGWTEKTLNSARRDVPVGATDANGHVDATISMWWGSDVPPQTDPQSPDIALRIRKSGFAEVILPFDLTSLVEVGGIREYSLADVEMQSP